MASLLRFAPWLRTIFIVADVQEPALVARIRGTPLAAREPSYAFACVQGLDQTDGPTRELIVDWLDARIGP